MSDTPPTSKACTKCGVVKPFGDFYKNKSTKDGLNYWCKVCLLSAVANQYKKNPERAKENAAKWQKENPEKVKVSQAKYREKYPEKILEKTKKWQAANPEKVRLIGAKSYAKNLYKHRQKYAKYVENLAACYVASIIGIPVSQVPPEILELKREAIAMKRISKQIKQITNPKKAAS